MPTATLDVKGMSCPSPIMQVKKKMFSLDRPGIRGMDLQRVAGFK